MRDPTTQPILHHYDASPWAEVARLALGLKGLEWGSVIIPTVCPKPELATLTGGYVRTPVLQIGADVFCDTLAILEALEVRWPEPSLYPPPLGAGHRALALKAGGPVFLAAVGVALADLPDEGFRGVLGRPRTSLRPQTRSLPCDGAVPPVGLRPTSGVA